MQVSPPLEEKEMTKLFLKTLSSFYYDIMVASAPSDFTEMVNMVMRLEEGVHKGRLKENGSSDSSRKYGNGLSQKKEHDANVISQERQSRSLRSNQHQQHVASVTLVINHTLVIQVEPNYQPCFQQHTHQQNCVQRQVQFDPISMSYAE